MASSFSKWPRLEEALKTGCIAAVDLSLASLLTETIPSASEALIAFFCHLSLCSRLGHLCVHKTKTRLFPAPETVWFEENDPNLFPSLLALCAEMHVLPLELPNHLLTKIEEGDFIDLCTPLGVYNDYYYFQKYWLFETSIHRTLKELCRQKPRRIIDEKQLEEFLKSSSPLNEQQTAAIQSAATSCCTILSGGPGTGKSYTARRLIEALSTSLADKQADPLKIILAAPTGKATNHLKSHLNASACICEAKTLHALLRVRSSARDLDSAIEKLDADLIVIDESSMIDVKLFSLLLDSIKPGTRLVLIGDPYQLPPVEVGTIFKDAIHLLKSQAPSSLTELHLCLRAENRELVTFADWVKNGNEQKILESLESDDSAQVVKRLSNSQKIVEHSLARFPSPYYKGDLPADQLLKSYEKFRLLSPLKNGPLGVLELNRKIHEKRYAQVPEGEFFSAPIMVTANDYKIDLFNGETGILIAPKGKKHPEERFALFPNAAAEGGFRKIPEVLLPSFEYAYCISVHKSQGSEFEKVLLVLPEGSERFGREVLYTAVTRSKKSLEIFATNSTLEATLKRNNIRMSRLFTSC